MKMENNEDVKITVKSGDDINKELDLRDVVFVKGEGLVRVNEEHDCHLIPNTGEGHCDNPVHKGD